MTDCGSSSEGTLGGKRVSRIGGMRSCQCLESVGDEGEMRDPYAARAFRTGDFYIRRLHVSICRFGMCLLSFVFLNLLFNVGILGAVGIDR